VGITYKVTNQLLKTNIKMGTGANEGQGITCHLIPSDDLCGLCVVGVPPRRKD